MREANTLQGRTGEEADEAERTGRYAPRAARKRGRAEGPGEQVRACTSREKKGKPKGERTHVEPAKGETSASQEVTKRSSVEKHDNGDAKMQEQGEVADRQNSLLDEGGKF
ncbi:hypothetical protein TRVL_06165 [Trypanosoma vivax]|nr:hypothetical protein TRVL_06165 [Trypanosoma vivax]